MRNFLIELRERNVLRTGVAYVASAWLLLNITRTIIELYQLPLDIIKPLVSLLGVGFILSLALRNNCDFT